MGGTGQTGGMAADKRISWLHDVRPADWIESRLHAFCVDTGSIIPEGFDAYCRIFHPVQTREPEAASRTWAEVATENGRVVHPGMQIHMIWHPVGSRPLKYDLNDYLNNLAWGELPLPERTIFVEVLRPHTTTPGSCWFCVWEGFGSIDFDGVSERVHLPERDYVLYAGPIEVALATLDTGPAQFASDPTVQPWNTQSPNLWWPDDRSWFVATEIDHAWTYVGGSEALIDSILNADGLEALPVHISDSPFIDGDDINAALDVQ